MNCDNLNITSNSDYYPFGMLMPNRHGQSDDYRYGYQGSESDDEVHGTKGSSYTTHFRQLDTRIGRWLSRDPMADKFPWQSPYVSMDNNPITLNDPLGDWTKGKNNFWKSLWYSNGWIKAKDRVYELEKKGIQAGISKQNGGYSVGYMEKSGTKPALVIDDVSGIEYYVSIQQYAYTTEYYDKGYKSGDKYGDSKSDSRVPDQSPKANWFDFGGNVGGDYSDNYNKNKKIRPWLYPEKDVKKDNLEELSPVPFELKKIARSGESGDGGFGAESLFKKNGKVILPGQKDYFWGSGKYIPVPKNPDSVFVKVKTGNKDNNGNETHYEYIQHKDSADKAINPSTENSGAKIK